MALELVVSLAPGWIVINAVGRIGHHKARFALTDRSRDRTGIGAVATNNTVLAQKPNIAKL